MGDFKQRPPLPEEMRVSLGHSSFYLWRRAAIIMGSDSFSPIRAQLWGHNKLKSFPPPLPPSSAGIVAHRSATTTPPGPPSPPAPPSSSPPPTEQGSERRSINSRGRPGARISAATQLLRGKKLQEGKKKKLLTVRERCRRRRWWLPHGERKSEQRRQCTREKERERGTSGRADVWQHNNIDRSQGKLLTGNSWRCPAAGTWGAWARPSWTSPNRSRWGIWSSSGRCGWSHRETAARGWSRRGSPRSTTEPSSTARDGSDTREGPSAPLPSFARDNYAHAIFTADPDSPETWRDFRRHDGIPRSCRDATRCCASRALPSGGEH